MDAHVVELETDAVVAEDGKYDGPVLDAPIFDALWEGVSCQLTRLVSQKAKHVKLPRVLSD